MTGVTAVMIEPDLIRLADHGAYRFYQLKLPSGERVTVRLWDDNGSTFVATTIGGPGNITSGAYHSDEEAIIAHLNRPTELQKQAMAAGMNDGWWELSHHREGRLNGFHEDHLEPFATIWRDGASRAGVFYPNGWKGGEQAAECRAAYIGGWAIGVQRFQDGLQADGSKA